MRLRLPILLFAGALACGTGDADPRLDDSAGVLPDSATTPVGADSGDGRAAPDSASSAVAPDATGGGPDARPGAGGAGGAEDPDGEAADGAGGQASETGEPRSGATAADARAVLERARVAYEGLTSIRTSFRQEARNPLLRRTIRSAGTIYQRQPDLFLMDFDDPEGDVIVSDGSHLWVYYPSVDAAQVLRLPAARGAGATDLRSQFIGDPHTRFAAELRGSEAVDGRIADVLVLEPRGAGESYRTLVAWVDRRDGLARRFEITETNGLVRRFELTDMRRNPTLPDSLFRFQPPAGARVVDRG